MDGEQELAAGDADEVVVEGELGAFDGEVFGERQGALLDAEDALGFLVDPDGAFVGGAVALVVLGNDVPVGVGLADGVVVDDGVAAALAL